jgi:hypothetical protein
MAVAKTKTCGYWIARFAGDDSNENQALETEHWLPAAEPVHKKSAPVAPSVSPLHIWPAGSPLATLKIRKRSL